MTARLVHIYRHPIKSHGVEPLNQVQLQAGRTMPGDRVWAVAHDAAQLTEPVVWAPCRNFSRGAKAPGLMAVKARLAGHRVTLTHPALGEIAFAPDTEGDRLINWIRPVMPADRAQSARIVRVERRGMTDTDFPSVSLLGLESNRAVGQHLGQKLSPLRWRGNFWFDGIGPWAEVGWVGRQIRLGEALLEVREQITRCLATAANPATGHRDADTLGALRDGWGHQEFGVYAVVAEGGHVRVGDTLQVI